ncbi:MAG: FecR domain-containing protein [Gammaproteobacteria bacterium]|nr:FecR domain-containing protein [Gammaproteobacteria bacterium]
MSPRRIRETRLILVVSSCLLLMGCQSEQVISEPLVIGYVTNSQGFPVVNRNNQKYILARQSKIYAADIFDTNKLAKVEISLLDNTIITLGQRSHFVLHRFVQDDDSSSTRLTLTKGTLLTKMDNQGSLELQTPVAVIQLQGANIYASYAANMLEITMANDGTMVVSNDDGEVTIDAANLGTTVIAGSAPQTPYSWTLRKLQRVIEEITIQPLE